SGGATDLFVLNITGRVDLSGSSKIVVSGCPPSHVLLNVIGTGQDVHLSGTARIDGTVLAPSRKVINAPGLINGEIISGLHITISSGGSTRCPTCDNGGN